jgi:hypothetical protein
MELGKTIFVPYTDIEYWRLVALLDRLIDEVGEDEAHPLASLHILRTWPSASQDLRDRPRVLQGIPGIPVVYRI